MYIAGHAAAGALVATQVPDHPILAFTLGFASHFLLDVIPHGDAHHVENYYKTKDRSVMRRMYGVMVVDSAAAVMLVSAVFTYARVDHLTLAAGVIGGVLPDLLVGIDESIRSTKLAWFKRLHFRFHEALTDKFHVKPWHGMVAQIIVIAGMLYLI